MTVENRKPDLAFGGDAYKSIVLKPGGLLYTKYINRNLAWIFTRILYGFTPNQISIGAFLILFLALPLAYRSTELSTSLIVYLLLALNYILDSTDGQVSRLRKLGSPLGEWVDHTLDGVRIPLIHATLLLVLFRDGTDLTLAIFCALNIVFATSVFCGTELAGKILPTQVQKSTGTGSSIRSLIRNAVLLPADHGVFILIFAFVHDSSLFAPVYAAYGLYWTVLFFGYFVAAFRANAGRA